MDKHYYFLESSPYNSGLSKLAKKLIDYFDAKYDHAVVDKDTLGLVVGNLTTTAIQFHEHDKRCKLPSVQCHYNNYTESYAIYIDEWRCSCKKAHLLTDIGHGVN